MLCVHQMMTSLAAIFDNVPHRLEHAMSTQYLGSHTLSTHVHVCAPSCAMWPQTTPDPEHQNSFKLPSPCGDHGMRLSRMLTSSPL